MTTQNLEADRTCFFIFCLHWQKSIQHCLRWNTGKFFLTWFPFLLPFPPTLLAASRPPFISAPNITHCGVSQTFLLELCNSQILILFSRVPFSVLGAYKINFYFSKSNCLSWHHLVCVIMQKNLLFTRDEDGQIERLPLSATITF